MSQAAVSTAPSEPAPPEKKGSIARNAFHLLLGQVGTTALAVLLVSALGRFLDVTDLGLYYLASASSAFAFVVVDWGQTSYVISEVAKHPARAGDLLGSALLLRTAGALALSVVSVCVLLLFYDARTTGLCLLFMATNFPLFLAQAYGMVMRGRERMDLDAIISVANKVLVLAFSVAALALNGKLTGALIAQGMAGVGAVATAVFLIKRVNIHRVKANLLTIKELLVGGTPIVAMSIAASAQSYIDTLMLSKLSPVHVVGWYGAARNIFGTLAAPSFILGSAFFPRLSRAAKDLPQFRQELGTGLRPLLGLASLVAVGSYLFGDFATDLVFGKARFAQAADIIQASGPGQALLFVDVFFASAIIASGRSKQLALAKALSLVVTVGLNFALIHYFQVHHQNGGIGLVLASAGSEVVMFAAACLILPRGTLAPSLILDVARAGAASAGTLLFFRALPPFTGWLGIPLCVALFAGLAVATGLVRRAEFESLRGALRRSRAG